MRNHTVIQKIERLGLYLSASRPDKYELVRNVGALFVINLPHLKCRTCKGKFFYELHEIIAFRPPFLPWPVIDTDKLGIFCNVCGAFDRSLKARKLGALGGHVPKHGNLFNTLSFIDANSLQFPMEPTKEELLKLSSMLKRKLEVVRRHLAAFDPPYRGSS